MDRELHIVLVEPEIPQNTGNIARTCAAVGATLHLISPMGFVISERRLRRAAMDYWPLVHWQQHDCLEDFFSLFSPEECILTSSQGKIIYCNYPYPSRSVILFGKESSGLDTSLLETYPSHTLAIPMREGIRSLNLSNAVAIIAYEVHCQWDFTSL